MFEVMNSLDKDVYFFTRERKLHNTLSNKYHDQIVFSFSVKALLIFLTSEKIILSHGVYDTVPFNPFHKSKKTILLWHGFPFKKTGINMHGFLESESSKLINIYKKTDLMVSGSKIESKILSDSFGVEINNIFVTGYPRYDLLLNPKENLLAELGFSKSKKIILYAPTFRDNTNISFFPFDNYSYSALLKLLEELDAIMLLRFHKNDKGNVEDKVTFNDRIINFDQNQLQEVNEILPFVDLLITDYSSILMDFVILDKPMMFLPYDVDSYKLTRGLNFEWESFYPGAVIFTFDDFIKGMKHLLMDPSLDSDKRQKMISKYHQYEFGSATSNVIHLIDKL